MHYIFTPRGVTKILEGLRQFELNTEEDLYSALIVKSNQIYKNKLATPADRTNFDKILSTISQKELSGMIMSYSMSDRVATKLSYNLPSDNKDNTSTTTKATKKGDTKDNTTPGLEKPSLLYSGKIKMTKKETLMKIIYDGLQTYEKDHGALNIYLSDEIIEMLLNYEHILCSKEGNILSSGISGQGRMMTCKFICHLLGLDFQTFFTSRGYDLRSFKKDMKRI